MLIKIKNLRLKTILGIHAWEAEIEREIIINAEIETDEVKSLQTDDIADTVDYDSLVSKIKELIATKRFKLIEKMTQEVVNVILQDKRVKKCRVEVDKVGVVKEVDSFSVTIEQKQNG